MSACGTCTMCCKLIKVDDEDLKKPANEWCSKCDVGRGCSIYESRPKSCAAYECAWLQSQAGEKPMPLELRPDRSKVIINPTAQGDGFVLLVDPAYPTAWRSGAMGRVFDHAMTVGLTAVVIVGDNKRVIHRWKEKKFREVDKGHTTDLILED